MYYFMDRIYYMYIYYVGILYNSVSRFVENLIKVYKYSADYRMSGHTGYLII